MSRIEAGSVVGLAGLRGIIESGDPARPDTEPTAVIRLDDGRRIVVPVTLMTQQADGTYAVPIGPADVDRLRFKGPGATAVIPVVVEELEVATRIVETGRVQISKRVHEREEVVDLPLLREEVDIQRVAVNRVVEGPVTIRQEGDTTIIPVVEEVLVVEKRLMLKEELRITKRRVEEHRPQRVTLRTEDATVERLAPQDRPKA